MPREITLRIKRDGGVETELNGFPGQDCIAEAEKLQRLLAELGLKLNLDDLALKSPEAIASEVGTEDKRKAGRKQR